MKEKIPLNFEKQKETREFFLKKVPESPFFGVTISEEDREKIGETGEVLAKNPSQNVVVYFNHTSYIDILYAGYVANLIDPEMTRELIAPMSYSHTEDDTFGKKIKNCPILLLVNKAQDCGITTERVIQSYQIDNPKYGYTKEKAYKVNREFPRIIREKTKAGKSTIVMISPEGHRSKGALMKAETGMAMIGKMTDSLYVPIGIDYQGINTRFGLHIGETVIKIGKITKHNHENSLEAQTQEVMKNLAEVLPPERRGVYKEACLPEIRK